MSIVCPKCAYTRQAVDLAPDWQCPACGIAYAKFQPPTATEPTAPTPAAKGPWYAAIQSRAQAEQFIKEASGVFFLVVLGQVALAILVAPAIWLDAGAYLIGSLWLFLGRSRVAAVGLLLLTLLETLATVSNLIGADWLGTGGTGGKNVLVALIVLGVSIRSVEATFKLHGRFAPPKQARGKR